MSQVFFPYPRYAAVFYHGVRINPVTLSRVVLSPIAQALLPLSRQRVLMVAGSKKPLPALVCECLEGYGGKLFRDDVYQEVLTWLVEIGRA
ncbi:MAG: hypothetical protein OJI67_10145, partial [Prosthecobacter sp.]|nr:hypothetical protein [Prosthecobacter sp.]